MAAERSVVDINILPQEYRRPLFTSFQWALLLVLVLGIALGYNTYLGRVRTQDQVAALQAEQQRIRVSIDELAPRLEQADVLRQEIDLLRNRLGKAQRVHELLQGQRLDWVVLFPAIFVTQPPGIELISLAYDADKMLIGGISTEGPPAIAQYYYQLKATPGVTQVFITKADVMPAAEKPGTLSFSIALALGSK